MRKNDYSEYLVDIPMCAYNHEKYIAQAIEGVINQKANFKYRLIIGEDCSQDLTRTIVESYLNKYPEKIKVLFHGKNLGAYENSKILFAECNAKYIALCDGDDYWTDPLKLQKQVDFLEANGDFNACFHNVKILESDGKDVNYTYQNDHKTEIGLRDLANGDYMHTCSLLFRNLPNFFYPFLNGLVPMDDDSIGYCLLLDGKKARYEEDVMAVYRKHAGGMWSPLSNETKVLWTIEHIKDSLDFYNDDILKPILTKRLKSEAYYLLKMSIRTCKPILLLKALRILLS